MDLKEILKNAGIVGAGGAGFPSYAKLADGADTLLVNGAECEPLLYTDYYLLKSELPLILCGISAVKDYLGVSACILSVKEHTAKRLGFTDGEDLGGAIVKVLADVYPTGDEITLIYESLGRVVKPGNLPITAGVIVYNVETLLNIGKAVKSGLPVTEKYLTVGGAVNEPIIAKVPVGMKVSDLFNSIGVKVCEGQAVLDGGPSMGKIIDPYSSVVTKTTKGLLVLPETTTAVKVKRTDVKKSVARAETACCQCMRCTDMCSRALLGYPLEPHKMVRTAIHAAELNPQAVLAATLCSGCGICETLACCQGISPRAVIAEYKALLAKNKMRYVGNVPVEVKKEREYRKIPSERWEAALGVKKYDKVPEYIGKINAKEVSVLLKGHIGAPSVSCVADGVKVTAGDKIADAAEGLSLPQYASVSGTAYNLSGSIVIKGE